MRYPQEAQVTPGSSGPWPWSTLRQHWLALFSRVVPLPHRPSLPGPLWPTSGSSVAAWAYCSIQATKSCPLGRKAFLSKHPGRFFWQCHRTLKCSLPQMHLCQLRANSRAGLPANSQSSRRQAQNWVGMNTMCGASHRRGRVGPQAVLQG